MPVQIDCEEESASRRRTVQGGNWTYVEADVEKETLSGPEPELSRFRQFF